VSRFADLQFGGEWRRYQRAALAAFERDLKHGNTNTHIVAPPGSGKTLLGVELIRRVGKRALVLAPNQAIQQQWPRAVMQFTKTRADAADIAGADVAKPIACLSYQALCQLEDPEILLGRLAMSRWADQRAAATGMSPEEALREGEAYEGAAADRRARELARISRTLKLEVARGEHATVELRDLLSETARSRVQTLANLGVGVVLLDECHHLASLWGYVVRAVLEELPSGVHVIGLTATPPVSLSEDDRELYDALLGPVDFTVPTPAVVRDGHLAPYQELAWLTEPLSSEKQWLAEHDQRFRELVTALHDDAESDISFPGWVIKRLRDRSAPRTTTPRCRGRRSRSAPPRSRAPACASWPARIWRCPRARRAARPTAGRRTSRTGSCCWRTTRCAAWRRPRRPRRPSATRPSPLPCASWASSSPAAGSAAARATSTGSSPARRPRRSGWSRCSAPRSTPAATRCAGSCCAMPNSPPSAPTTR